MNENIYIKTEPGGRIYFGKLADSLSKSLWRSLETKELSVEIQNALDDPSTYLTEHKGVTNIGYEGTRGNIGIIRKADRHEVALPQNKSGGLADGAYVLIADLSKVSVEFEIETDEEFDVDLLIEEVVKVSIPEEISHPIYGALKFNLVINYEYDGHPIPQELIGDIVDRGYERFVSLILVSNGKVFEAYREFGIHEYWGNLSDI